MSAPTSVQQAYQIGKLTPFGTVYAGRYNIGEGLECDLFALPQSLQDITGDIYSCRDTMKITAGLVVGGRDCFTSHGDPAEYMENVKRYLLGHIIEHTGDCCAESKVFIPWLRPVQVMVNHKRAHGVTSDFVLPRRSDDVYGDLTQSCQPHSALRDYMGVVCGWSGDIDWAPRNYFRFGCVPFVAAPAPR